MTQSLEILACQIDIPEMTSVHERDAHLSVSAGKVSQALQKSEFDLVVLPELSSIDYARQTFDILCDLAEPLDGASFQVWAKIAQKHGVYIAYSFARKGIANNYICVAVVGPNGALVGHYDKLHLAQYGASMEKEYFARGNHLFSFQIKSLKFAPIICYDIRIPELCRTLVLDHDVDVILHCGAYFRDTSFATWHDFTTTRALENQVFLLSLNRAGEYYGNSRFCYPWMDETRKPIVFSKHVEDFKTINIDPAEIRDARETYSFLKDRLPDYEL